MVLSEGTLLGGGARRGRERVDLVDDRSRRRRALSAFALKRMRKLAVMSTPEHIFCERNVTREMTHWACMRQHASFKDETYLYFLLDFVDGWDLMDALAAVAAVTSVRDPAKTLRPR